MPTDAILSTARQYLGVDPSVPVVLEPIQRGASGRTIMRVRAPGHDPFIGIHATDERADNRHFVPVARFLHKAKVRVPAVLHDNPSRRACLVEDLGDTHLLDLRAEPFEQRLPLYRSALEQIDRLFYAKAPDDLELMPPFDAGLYRWEQDYFFEHLVEGLLGLDAGPLRGHPALGALAAKLGSTHRHLVHRDFQSQNIMVRGGQAWLLDFQGLRRGRQEYDLASLVHDPYLDHSPAECEQLMELWEEIAEDRPEQSLFNACAAQRLMQALGAYGNISLNLGKHWYRQHVPPAARHLRQVVAGTPLAAPLAPVLDAAEQFA